MESLISPPAALPKPHGHAFRNAVVRGMGVVLPPLLTIVIFVWVGNTVQDYVFAPVTSGVRDVLVWSLADVRDNLTEDPNVHTVTVAGRAYQRLEDNTFVPKEVYDLVRKHLGSDSLPASGKVVYARFVDLTYLRPYYTIPFFLTLFVLLLYLVGNFIAAGLGHYLLDTFEHAIGRLPLVRNVYAAVKQVSDFFFSKREFQFTRVVAIEYPRRDMWIMGFVTGEGLLDIRDAVKEPVLGVFVPTSPMPMSGYALWVPKRDVIDLNLTIDQAIQFLVSCGVVIPPLDVQELQRLRTPEPVAAKK